MFLFLLFRYRNLTIMLPDIVTSNLTIMLPDIVTSNLIPPAALDLYCGALYFLLLRFSCD